MRGLVDIMASGSAFHVLAMGAWLLSSPWLLPVRLLPVRTQADMGFRSQRSAFAVAAVSYGQLVGCVRVL
jgi:hypothetical protein